MPQLERLPVRPPPQPCIVSPPPVHMPWRANLGASGPKLEMSWLTAFARAISFGILAASVGWVMFFVIVDGSRENFGGPPRKLEKSKRHPMGSIAPVVVPKLREYGCSDRATRGGGCETPAPTRSRSQPRHTATTCPGIIFASAGVGQTGKTSPPILPFANARGRACVGLM